MDADFSGSGERNSRRLIILKSEARIKSVVGIQECTVSGGGQTDGEDQSESVVSDFSFAGTNGRTNGFV